MTGGALETGGRRVGHWRLVGARDGLIVCGACVLSADVHVNASVIDYNQDTGVNITYGGGLRVINRTSVSHNFGNGVNVTLNETHIDNKTRYAKQQITEVFFSDISFNEGHGVRVGNFCQKGNIAINDTKFQYNRGNAVDLTSCFKIIDAANVTNMTVAYNSFEGNYGHAIVIAPLLNAVGRIANNTFMRHERHTLLIDNSDDLQLARQYRQLKVDYEIEANDFLDNRGFYVVNARLTEGSNVQHMYIRYNHFKQNVISGSFVQLNERSRAHAVVIVSSTNVNFSRNWLEDPDSRFEIATQLVDKSKQLDVARQWWHEARDRQNPDSGNVHYSLILPYLFDQFSRCFLPREALPLILLIHDFACINIVCCGRKINKHPYQLASPPTQPMVLGYGKF